MLSSLADDALPLKRIIAEVQKDREPKPGCCQVVSCLCSVLGMQVLDRFKLKDDFAVYHHIGNEVTDYYTFI